MDRRKRPWFPVLDGVVGIMTANNFPPPNATCEQVVRRDHRSVFGMRPSKRQQRLADLDAAREAEARTRALASHVEQGPPTGCGDSGCIIARRGGQCTNGGCRCDVRALQAAVLWYRFEYEQRAISA